MRKGHMKLFTIPLHPEKAEQFNRIMRGQEISSTSLVTVPVCKAYQAPTT